MQTRGHSAVSPMAIIGLAFVTGCSSAPQTENAGNVGGTKGSSASNKGGASSTSGASSSALGGSSTRGGSSNSDSIRGGSSTGGSSRAAGGTSSSSESTQATEAGGAVGVGGRAAKGGAEGRGGSSVTRNQAGANNATRAGAASTASSGSAGTSASSGQLAISNLKVEANSKNVLSCFVSWKTDQPADSVVQFGAGKYEWEISDTQQVTDHRVLVIGMHASQAYQIKAISNNSSGNGSAEGKFTAGTLPATIPVGKVTVIDKTKMQSGWTLMNIQKGDGTATARSKTPNQAVMYDADGQPVWYYINGTTVDRGGAVPVEVTDKGILIGAIMDDSGSTKEPPREIDFAGNVVWECSTPTCGGSGNLTHHASKLPNGNYIIQRDVTVNSVIAPVFEEITKDNKVVWSLDYRKMVTPPSSATGDWCHGNSITVNIEKDEVYANCRFMGLIKTSYKNPTLKWHMGAAYGAKDTGTIKFSPTTSQYSDTHDPEIHDDGTIIFFDNGGYSGVIGEEGNPNNYHSRVVEYKIDETAKTATLVWEFPGSFNVDSWYKTKFYLPFWGDADRLANGNVLVTAGVRGTTVQSRIFEVTKQDGKVVWEFQLPTDFGVYRSERLPTPPLVHAIGG